MLSAVVVIRSTDWRRFKPACMGTPLVTAIIQYSYIFPAHCNYRFNFCFSYRSERFFTNTTSCICLSNEPGRFLSASETPAHTWQMILLLDILLRRSALFACMLYMSCNERAIVTQIPPWLNMCARAVSRRPHPATNMI